MSNETDAGLEDFAVGGATDLMNNLSEPSPIEQVEQMIARNQASLERLTENVKQTRELLKRLRATLKVMRESTLD